MFLLVFLTAMMGFRYRSIQHGRNIERQRQMRKLLDGMELKGDIDNEIETLDDNELHDRSLRWVRGYASGDE